jgi:hypothetical protein
MLVDLTYLKTIVENLKYSNLSFGTFFQKIIISTRFAKHE